MEKKGNYTEEQNTPETPETPAIPTASALVERIRGDVMRAGEEFRSTHPELVRRLSELLGSIKCGREIYVENRHREFNVSEVTQCLYGLGYEVKPAHPMVQNDYGAFRIVWWPDNKPNPYLG